MLSETKELEIQNYLIILARVVFICYSNFYLCLRSWLRSMFGIFLYKHIVICVVGVTLHNGNDITVKQSVLLDSYFYGSISKWFYIKIEVQLITLILKNIELSMVWKFHLQYFDEIIWLVKWRKWMIKQNSLWTNHF